MSMFRHRRSAGSSRRVQTSCFGLLAVLMLASVGAFADALVGRAEALQPQALTRWFDQQIEPALGQRGIAAAFVVVVQNGQILLDKDYRGAELESVWPADASHARIRLASISKVFTATAIAQLVQSGAIKSLDDPANTYLRRVQLPENDGRAVTIHDLITHTAGFEDSMFGTAIRRPVQLPLSAEQIRLRIPEYARPVGQLDYSNAGYGVLGVVIEDITGASFADYVRARILEPLRMHDTSIEYGLAAPEGVAPMRALHPDSGSEPISWAALHPFMAPAGSFVSTPADMIRFIDAVARSAAHEANGLLSAQAQDAMFQRRASSHPEMTGIGMGWFTQVWNGERVVEHGGDLPGSHSMLVLLPDRRLGLFISVVGEGVGPGATAEGGALDFAPRQVSFRFLEHLLGPRQISPVERESTALLQVEGDYVFQRRAHRTFRVPDQVLSVRRNSEGHLQLARVGVLQPLGHGLYKGPERGVFNYVAFTPTPGGGMQLVPYFPFSVAERVSGFANPRFVSTAAAIGALLLLTGLAALRWPAALALEKWAKRVPSIALAVAVLAAAVALAPLSDGASLVEAYAYGESAGVTLLSAISQTILLGAMGMTLMLTLAWHRAWWGEGRQGLARRVHYGLLTLSLWALIPAAAYMNLLRWP